MSRPRALDGELNLFEEELQVNMESFDFVAQSVLG
jgi:hypothetical protein